MDIFTNRVLNLRRIRAIGFDMDYTLVRYKSENFEALTYKELLRKLVHTKGYPERILKLEFDFHRAIRGLVIDRKFGNVLKVSLYGKVKQCMHGLKALEYREFNKYYRGLSIDLSDSRYYPIDTTFAISHCVLFMQLVDLKDHQGVSGIPDYTQLDSDIMEVMDLSHMDGTLKDHVVENPSDFLIPDPETVQALERFKRGGKELWVITNSDYTYSKSILDYCITPYLKDHKCWSELFQIVVTLASKPRFFTDNLRPMWIRPEDGLMENMKAPMRKGIYQGGCATLLQGDLDIGGDDILYVGDHIYGDILSLKKACNWRTALVVEELAEEIRALEKSKERRAKIDQLMLHKEYLEIQQDKIFLDQIDRGEDLSNQAQAILDEIKDLDKTLSNLIIDVNQNYNPYWGELMRAGGEPSRFAGQVEKYACIYMSKISDLVQVSDRKYFRPPKRALSHDLLVDRGQAPTRHNDG